MPSICIWNTIKEKDVFIDVKGGKWGMFRLAKKLALPSVPDFKKCPLFQYAYEGKIITPGSTETEKAGKAIKMRLEFVPVDLGSKGMLELQSILVTIMPNGWNYVVEHGHVTRLDIAVIFLTS